MGSENVVERGLKVFSAQCFAVSYCHFVILNVEIFVSTSSRELEMMKFGLCMFWPGGANNTSIVYHNPFNNGHSDVKLVDVRWNDYTYYCRYVAIEHSNTMHI